MKDAPSAETKETKVPGDYPDEVDAQSSPNTLTQLQTRGAGGEG